MWEQGDGEDATPEAARIRRVYRSYATPERARLYDEANPGNRAIVAERVRLVRGLLAGAGWADLGGLRILDVGCGHGGELARMLQLGARADDLLGIDLMPDRVEAARRTHPEIEFRVADATSIDLPAESFDLVLSFTVLSSVLDDEAARRIAGEMSRVLRPGGAVVWYDLRRGNPRNPNVRGLPARAVRRCFPELQPSLRPVTLAPPLARRLGPLTPTAYPVLAALRPLRTHLIGLLRKPPAEPSR